MPLATQPPEQQRPIDVLRPGSEAHARMLRHLKDRIQFSADEMARFHARWRVNELKMTAYVQLGDFEQQLKEMNDAGKPASAISITVPYSWATIMTIVTYMMHTFGGRKPIFSVGSYNSTQVQRAPHIETLLQYNADRTKLLSKLYQFFMDGEQYGLGVMRTLWKKETKSREVIVPPTPEEQMLYAQLGLQATGKKQTQDYVCFEGSTVDNIDPFMFYPDPRVPMSEVSEKGEFVAWRDFMSPHALKKAEAKGSVRWVKEAGSMSAEAWDTAMSARSTRTGGEAHPGQALNKVRGNGEGLMFVQVDQISIEIVPAEWGLSPVQLPEKWLFSIANGRQIIQAVPLKLNHGKHPVVVAEPNSMGYAFGHLGTSDLLGPMQDMMSWFINSHIYNVRTMLNNNLIVDPTKVELQDLKKRTPGGMIRLKNVPFGGMDPRQAVMQLPVSDVTRSHISDFQLFGRMASDLTGASDNLRGLQESGGRKTASEVRMTNEAGASRMAMKAKVYSMQALVDLAEQQTSNFQQFLSQEMELAITGPEGQTHSIRYNQEMLQGEWVFPIHDGTLPLDKVAMLDIWKEIFQVALTEPSGMIRQNYNLIGIFEWMAQLGGIQNLPNFKITPAAPNVIDQQVQMGNMVPLGQMPGAPPMMGGMGG